MADVVAGLLASGFLSIAKNKLSSAIADQANMLCNFSVDLEGMMDVLETISAVLEDAERRSVKEKLVQLWLKRLKDVAIDISDLLQDYQDTSDQTTAKTPRVLSCLPVAYKVIAVANRMNSLREKLRNIRNEIGSFNFVSGNSTTMEQPYDERETTSDLPQEPLIGRDGEKQEIINLLSANTSIDDGIVIVAIYGLGGMGKSTLAQLVYNDAQFKMYDHRIWVYVSQDFNLNKIGSSIISQLRSQIGQQNTGIQQVINQCLENLFRGKEVLIILDDLWEEKKTELDKLRRMLYVKGSKVDVIVTTRKEDIARKVSTCEPYKLRPLDDDKCWKIIERFSRFELKSNQENLKHIGLDIARKCGGVALAAQAIGFMLQNINDVSGWTNINGSDLWNGSSEESEVLPSLKLSYERMPPQLRICFSFCAIFPKGHNFIEDDLVQQWISLGFIEQSKGKEYFKKLLGMSFLHVSKLHSPSHVVRYTMHDLVHDLARLTVEDELIVFDVAPRRNARAHKYCRYSVLRKYDTTVKLTNMPSKMRALRFSGTGDLLDISSGAFSFAKCLRTLDFSECSGILLPASIGKLKQLRWLIAPKMKNDSLPDCITKLYKLQYLNINGSSKIIELPESFGDLKYMVHLDMSDCSGLRELPSSLGNLTSLQHLELSRCSNLKAIPESLCGITQLQYLNLSSCGSLDQIPESICNLGCLKYLCLSRCAGISKLPESFGDLKCMVHLDMSGCSWLKQLPDSLGNLTHLQHLELSGCSSIKAVPQSLCGLTQLQYLNISSCAYLERLPEGIGSLVGLKYLNMSGCGHIRKLPESMMKLQSLLHLNLSGCRRMSLACLRGLTALQHLDISHLRDSYHEDFLKSLILRNYHELNSYDFITTLTNLEHLDLSRNYKIVYLPEIIGNLKRLHTLDLSYCYGLKSLPKSIGTLQLKSLVLEGCSDAVLDQASSLVNYSQTLPAFKVRADYAKGCSNLHLLEGVHVSELRIRCLENVRSLEEAKKLRLSDKHNLCKLTLSWSTKRAVQIFEDQDLLEQLVPPKGLKSMCLHGYSSKSFPGWLMCLTNLVSIQLRALSTCSNLPPLGQLPHLEKLSLRKLPGIKRINREFCGGRGAFRRLSSFTISWMEGLEEWNTTYSVENTRLEEFMFPVLDRLEVLGCPRLRFKPCPPRFRECYINGSGQVIYSLEEVDKTSHHCSSSSQAIKLDLDMVGAIKLDLDMVADCCQSMRLLHHFPSLRELRISGLQLKSLPESMRRLTSLESLTLQCCYSISALPEWLGDLSSLKSLVISACQGIRSLPECIQQLAKLQTLEISYCPRLKRWCESDENKAKLAHISNARIRVE